MSDASSLNAPLVEAEHVFVTFPALRALDDVSLVIRQGEHVLIRGGNGAGKSTLLRVLRGEQWPDQARSETGAGVVSRGRVIWHTPSGPELSPLAGRNMSGLVSASQQETIVRRGWNITGEELVAGGLAGAAFPGEDAVATHRERVRETAALLGAEALLPRFVFALSQGELRLLLAARALARRPALLLLDEVTEGLDAPARRRLLDALAQAAGASTLVMTTHRPETVPFWLCRSLVMERGRLAGSLAALRPESPQAGENRCPAPSPAPVRDGGDQGAAAPPALPAGTGGAGIALSHVTVYIDGTPVLNDLNWNVRPGENWAVLGGNGAGKSTLLRLLAGDECAALGGTVRYIFPGRPEIAERALAQRPLLEDLRRSVHLVSDLQQAAYGYDVTGADLVFSGFDNAVGVYREATEQERAGVDDMLRRLGAAHLAERRIRTCSSGELRRLLLARALVGGPALLLLDEPCSGLDAESRAAFLRLLEELALSGVQMILVTHHAGDLIPAVSRILHLEGGRITAID